MTLFRFQQSSITQQVVKGLYNGATTQEVNTLAAETAATMTTEHSDYALLAGRLCVLILHKETKNRFSGKKKNFTKKRILGFTKIV